LRRVLERNGLAPLLADSGASGLRQLYAGRPELVLLDIELPNAAGYAALERIRGMTDVPVVRPPRRTRLRLSLSAHQRLTGARGRRRSHRVVFMPLEPGIARQDEFTVADRLLTDVGGTIGVKVLSTPGMIAMMERNASLLAYEQLEQGQATVGFEVCVKHVAAAAEGARCTVYAVLREVIEARKLRFDVEVRAGERTIGVGTHERRVIDVARHAQSARS
jgi:predicted thioesterase